MLTHIVIVTIVTTLLNLMQHLNCDTQLNPMLRHEEISNIGLMLVHNTSFYEVRCVRIVATYNRLRCVTPNIINSFIYNTYFFVDLQYTLCLESVKDDIIWTATSNILSDDLEEVLVIKLGKNIERCPKTL